MHRSLLLVLWVFVGCSTPQYRPPGPAAPLVDLHSNVAARTGVAAGPIQLSGLLMGLTESKSRALLAQLQAGVVVQDSSGKKIVGEVTSFVDSSANNYFEVTFTPSAALVDGWYDLSTGLDFAQVVTSADVGLRSDVARGYVARFRVGSDPLLVLVSRCASAVGGEVLELRFSEPMVVPDSMVSTVRLTPLSSAKSAACDWSAPPPSKQLPPMNWVISCGVLPTEFSLQVQGAVATASGLEVRSSTSGVRGFSRDLRQQDFTQSGDCKTWSTGAF